MRSSIRIFQIAAIAGMLAVTAATAIALDLTPEPDSIVLRDGAIVRGLIVRSIRGDITIQTTNGEETYTRSQISRVHDTPGEGRYLTDVERQGSLPPWRTIINDLRHNDGVRSLKQIPATVIDVGEFRNVPYLSFRLNGYVELNIYGAPEDPAGIELGIYGPKQGNSELRRICREFLVSYLNTRAEIQAIYQLNENGGLRDTGDMTIEYTPAKAPDAYGAWWISIYNRKHLTSARLTDAEYLRLTRPLASVIDKDGQVRDTAWTSADASQSLRLRHSGNHGGERLFVRGFYRDKNGDFRIVTAP